MWPELTCSFHTLELLLSVLQGLSPVVEVLTFSQFLQHSSPELSPVFILVLLETKGLMKLCRMAAQERIVRLLFPDGGGTLERSGGHYCPHLKDKSRKWLEVNTPTIEERLTDRCFRLFIKGKFWFRGSLKEIFTCGCFYTGKLESSFGWLLIMN